MNRYVLFNFISLGKISREVRGAIRNIKSFDPFLYDLILRKGFLHYSGYPIFPFFQAPQRAIFVLDKCQCKGFFKARSPVGQPSANCIRSQVVFSCKIGSNLIQIINEVKKLQWISQSLLFFLSITYFNLIIMLKFRLYFNLSIRASSPLLVSLATPFRSRTP